MKNKQQINAQPELRRTGIYGGSFNPIHDGHTRLAQALIDLGVVEELWFVVSPQNPFKRTSTNLLDDEARLSLVRLAVEGHPGMDVSDVEMHMPRPSYMADTLALLRQQHPDRQFVLVIGADNWQRFGDWHHADDIMRHHPIVIYPRPGYSIDASLLPKGVALASTPMIDISSTQIRSEIKQGHYDGKGISAAVWREIKTKGYYQ